ncbi:hypothetical protein [Massilia sp.]|uniref:hypothetical protein n=1 Tax=Massilia sp. TaxID=1882437 RepID=UPI0028A25514|nr:hypothetical protein [Massilia sp.]
MSAYQEFLDFFSMHNKERLDGLSEGYFTAMNQKERAMAYAYLLDLVRKGGTEESVNGLFMADFSRAVDPVEDLLKEGELNGEAQISAAWNLSKIRGGERYFQIFEKFMSDSDSRLRTKAVYYVPDDISRYKLEPCLKGMIRTETTQLPRIHAVNKLLDINNINKSTIGEKLFKEIYRGLHSDDAREQDRAFKKIENLRDG